MTLRRFLAAASLALATLTASAATPYVPTDAERARWTMHDMKSWQIALGAYRIDHKEFPAAKTPEEVRAAVEPTYVMHLPMTDAWGNPYRFEPDGKGGWLLVSAGADGKFAPDSWAKSGKLPSFDDDAVLTSNDQWLSRSWIQK